MFSSLQNFKLPITLIAPVLMFYGKLSRPLAKTDLFSIKTQWHSNERGGCWVRSDHLSCPEKQSAQSCLSNWNVLSSSSLCWSRQVGTRLKLTTISTRTACNATMISLLLTSFKSDHNGITGSRVQGSVCHMCHVHPKVHINSSEAKALFISFLNKIASRWYIASQFQINQLKK